MRKFIIGLILCFCIGTAYAKDKNVTVSLDEDYVNYLEEVFNMPIEDLIKSYINAEAEGAISVEYKKVEPVLTPREQLNKIKEEK